MEKKKRRKWNIKPSARDKRRYFTTNVSGKKIEEAILEYIGILGLSKAAYEVVRVKGAKKTIGSCLAGSIEDVRASLAFKGIEIDNVSGTIKGLGC